MLKTKRLKIKHKIQIRLNEKFLITSKVIWDYLLKKNPMKSKKFINKNRLKVVNQGLKWIKIIFKIK